MGKRGRRRGFDGRSGRRDVARDPQVATVTDAFADSSIGMICELSDEEWFERSRGVEGDCRKHRHISVAEANQSVSSLYGKMAARWLTPDGEKSTKFAGVYTVVMARVGEVRDRWKRKKDYSPNGGIGVVTLQYRGDSHGR